MQTYCYIKCWQHFTYLCGHCHPSEPEQLCWVEETSISREHLLFSPVYTNVWNLSLELLWTQYSRSLCMCWQLRQMSKTIKWELIHSTSKGNMSNELEILSNSWAADRKIPLPLLYAPEVGQRIWTWVEVRYSQRRSCIPVHLRLCQWSSQQQSTRRQWRWREQPGGPSQLSSVGDLGGPPCKMDIHLQTVRGINNFTSW